MTEPELLTRLQSWLTHRRGQPVTVAAKTPPRSGFSADNLVFTATTAEHASTHVLRRDRTTVPAYPEQAPGLGTGVELQAAVMRALSPIVLTANNIDLETDPSVLGSPFLIMDFVEGVVPIEYPACTLEGFFVQMAPVLRHTMITEGLTTLAGLHTTPWRHTPLELLHSGTHAPGAARQLALWDAHLYNGLQGRRAGVLEQAASALRRTLPAQPPPDEVVLVWGDARLGNVIWDPISAQPLCVTDFEGACLGERELDLGWWLLADRWMHEGSGAARLSGEPSRAQQVAHYQQVAGVQVREMGWYELFAAYRFAASVVAVMNRWVLEGRLPPDHMLWRDNPATALIIALLDEQAAGRP